jgi:hypothetical protein
MPIKTFTFAFKLDAKELLNYVVERNIAVDIHATGTKRELPPPEQPALPATPQLALPPPTRNNGKPGSKNIVLLFVAQHKSVSTSEINSALEEAGYSPNTSHGLLFNMRKEGLLLRAGKARYRISAKGQKIVEVE